MVKFLIRFLILLAGCYVGCLLVVLSFVVLVVYRSVSSVSGRVRSLQSCSTKALHFLRSYSVITL